jgi:ribosomal protein S3AE
LRIIEAGHIYELQHLESDGIEKLTFIKRSSKAINYGDTEHAGTNTQEVIRALINRTEFLYDILPAVETKDAAYYLRMALFCYEARAYRRKQAKLNKTEIINDYEERYDDIPFNEQDIESRLVGLDGHIIL